MTAMEKFRNDLKAHKGQEKLLIDRKLFKHLKRISELQKKFQEILNGEIYSKIEDSMGNVVGVKHVTPLSGYFKPFMKDVEIFTSAFSGITNSNDKLSSSSQTDDETDRVVDGAEFINFMNVATEVVFFETFYLKNIPKQVSMGYFYRIEKALGIMPNYIAEIRWVYRNSSYDPKYSRWDTYGMDKKISIFEPFTTEQVLDKPVSK